MQGIYFPKRFIATRRSLGAARKISELLGEPFDEEATKRVSEGLHEEYFQRIQSIIGADLKGVSLRSGSHLKANAFVPKASNAVYFDEFFDIWLFSCCHFTTIAACKSLSGEEYQQLIELFEMTLDMTSNAAIHFRLQNELLPLMLDHADCLELSHAMSRAMTVFCICHECAHVTLGHINVDASPGLEFDADKRAIEYFLRIGDAGTKAGLIFIHPKLFCSPLLLFRFLELVEQRSYQLNHSIPNRRTHPSPRERYVTLNSQLQSTLIPGSKYILDGFTAALTDIEEMAGFPPLPNHPH